MARAAVVLLAVAGAALPMAAQPPAPAAGRPSLFDLARRRPGEPTWAPVFRLRAAKADVAGDEAQRALWAQLVAQAEATVGEPLRALAAWDAWTPPSRDDGLAAVRRRFTTARRVPVLDTLLAMADTARVIMVNERHHAAMDRLLTLELLPALWAKGFRYFAAEALSADSLLATRGYAIDAGHYTSEPVFAEVVREALRLGYRLVPYEAEGPPVGALDSLTPQQQRDYGQAENLAAATVARDPHAKVLVHAGFDHILERASPGWSPMAAYLRARHGIDPVTVDQTRLAPHATPAHGHPVHRALRDRLPTAPTVFVSDSTGEPIAARAVGVDFVALRSAGPLIDGRPAYLTMGGRRSPVRVALPMCARVSCVVSAHRALEPDSATVLDRTVVDRRTAVTLFLPPESVRVTVHAPSGAMRAQWVIGPQPTPMGRRRRAPR